MSTTITQRSPARELRKVISSWYIAFRNIALVALLSVLVYIGIRIILSSSIDDKVKYKQMIVDWVVALCLVFLMHYIMSFAVTINEKFIDAIKSISVSTYGTQENFVGNNAKTVATTKGDNKAANVKADSGKIDEGKPEIFIITGNAAKRAYTTLTNDGEEKDSVYYNMFSEDGETFYFRANDFMSQARMLGQDESLGQGEDNRNENQSAPARVGYNIIYVVLVVFTVIFCFTYIRRVIYMAFLTIIAPLVAMTYPIDKINDGKAQAFDMWLKEYIFNLLIQPMHLILYTVLIGSAMKLASNNLIYVAIALGFMIPAEKLLRKFFGFEKASTPGGLIGGPVGPALLMSGMDKLRHKLPKGKFGPGKSDSGSGELEGENKVRTPFLNEDVDVFGAFGGNDNKGGILPKDKNAEYNEKLNQDQIDDLKAQGIKPGDNEYRMYLQNHGINEKVLSNSKNNENNKFASNKESLSNGKPTENSINGNNENLKINSNNIKKGKLKKAISAGFRNNGLRRVQRYKANKAQKGNLLRRGIRMTGGLAAAATMATAGGIIGTATGDPTKVIQAISAGAAGGYAVGKSVTNKAIDTVKENSKDDIKAAKEAYYGNDYKQHKQIEYRKNFVRDEDNLKKIEQKLKVDRKEAKDIANQIVYYTDKEGIENINDAMAIYQMTNSGYTEKEAIAAASYNNIALDGKDTRHMKAKDKNDYKTTYKERIKKKKGINEDQAETGATNLFNAMDMFNQFKN